MIIYDSPPTRLFIVAPVVLDYDQEMKICEMLVLLFNDPLYCHRVKPKWQNDFHYSECEYVICN